MVQVAWLWLRHQPDSALSLWFTDRVKRNGGRLKRTTIVAMARKLLVALWRYATSGVVIEGAILKAARVRRLQNTIDIPRTRSGPDGSRRTTAGS